MRTIHTFLQLFLFCTHLFMGFVEPDPDPLQDYCIVDTKNPQKIFINGGAPCINPDQAMSSHFATSALSKPGNTGGNIFGFNVTLANTINLPGINTMGLTMARVDIAANGLVPLHSHPRASEVTFLLKGVVRVGFIDTANRLFMQQLYPGESFVFPKGLVHFLQNLDSSNPALCVSGLSSQNPDAQLAALASFTSIPTIPDEVLKRSFQITSQDVSRIRNNLGVGGR